MKEREMMAKGVKLHSNPSITTLDLRYPVLDLGLSHMTMAEMIKVSVIEFGGTVCSNQWAELYTDPVESRLEKTEQCYKRKRYS